MSFNFGLKTTFVKPKKYLLKIFVRLNLRIELSTSWQLDKVVKIFKQNLTLNSLHSEYMHVRYVHCSFVRTQHVYTVITLVSLRCIYQQGIFNILQGGALKSGYGTLLYHALVKIHNVEPEWMWFLPVCVLLWILRFSLLAKVFPHPAWLHWNGFSPVWTLKM